MLKIGLAIYVLKYFDYLHKTCTSLALAFNTIQYVKVNNTINSSTMIWNYVFIYVLLTWNIYTLLFNQRHLHQTKYLHILFLFHFLYYLNAVLNTNILHKHTIFQKEMNFFDIMAFQYAIYIDIIFLLAFSPLIPFVIQWLGLLH